MELLAGLLREMTVMEVLDGFLFEADGDEEAEDDGGNVDGKKSRRVLAAWWAGWTSSMGVGSSGGEGSGGSGVFAGGSGLGSGWGMTVGCDECGEFIAGVDRDKKILLRNPLPTVE